MNGWLVFLIVWIAFLAFPEVLGRHAARVAAAYREETRDIVRRTARKE